MLTSATGQRKTITFKRQSGFTLVEVMVVLAIIALAAGVIALSAPPPVNRASDTADIAAARLNAASEFAIMNSATIGMEIDESGFEFYEYWRGEWRDAAARGLVGQRFGAETAAKFSLEEQPRLNERDDRQRRSEDAPAPTIFFAATGETTPFTLEINAGRRKATVSVDATGAVTVKRND